MEHLRDEELEQVSSGTKIPYRVKRGDTLGMLADKFHCTVEQICKWNHIEDPNKIEVDQFLEFRF